MARGRFLSSTIALDARFNALTMEAQLAFLRTLPHLDRDGRITGNTTALWAAIAPLQSSLLPIMDAIVGEWVNSGMVERFESLNGPALEFVSFAKNQAGMRYEREAPTLFERPHSTDEGDAGVSPELVRSYSGVSPEFVGSNSGPTPAQGEVKDQVQVKGQGQGQGGASPPGPRPPAGVDPEWPARMESLSLGEMFAERLRGSSLYRDGGGVRLVLAEPQRHYAEWMRSRASPRLRQALGLSADVELMIE